MRLKKINKGIGKKIILSSVVAMLGMPTLTGILGHNTVHNNIPTSNIFISTVYASDNNQVEIYRQAVENIIGTGARNKTLVGTFSDRSLKEKISQNKTLLSATVQSHYGELINHWSSSEWSMAIYTGVISGRSDGSIAPNELVSRAEMSVMLTKAYYGSNLASESLVAKQVLDTGGSSWFSSSWASCSGLLPFERTGTNQSELYNGSATRVEFAYALVSTYFPGKLRAYYEGSHVDIGTGNYVFQDITNVSELGSYEDMADRVNGDLTKLTSVDNDLPINYYAALKFMQESGIMVGNSGNSMYASPISRSEAISLINRSLEYRANN